MKKIIKSTILAFLILAGGIFFVLSNTFGGFRAFTVTSASMEPAISTSALVVTQYTAPATLQKGDIITFLPPTNDRKYVTHRITRSTHLKSLSTFKTKGDNNKQEDTWTLAGGAIVGKVIMTIPYLGFFISFLQSKLGILLFILIPAVFIIVNEIYVIIAAIKQHREKKVKTQEITTIVALFFFSLVLFVPQPTSAFLSDATNLSHNSFTIIQNSKQPQDDTNCK